MDVVITYVDGRDPIWQAAYQNFTKAPILNKRFRDWGTLKYLLRGIEKNMPFIEQVFLVVSSDSQVPDWVDRNNLKVILHEEIIPKEYLPTFNSTTIELFLHRIKGLGEQFIYFNDDTFPVMACEVSDFYRKNKIVLGFSSHLLALNMYKRQCRNSDRTARRILHLGKSPLFLRQQHTCTPMFRSENEKVLDLGGEALYQSISALREDKNVNQYVFSDYLYHQHRVIRKRQSKKHISLACTSPRKISSFLQHPSKKLICINDVELSDSKYQEMHTEILSSFNEIFPQKSHFEQ